MTERKARISKDGQRFLDLIARGIDTQEALERADRARLSEDTARTISSLARQKVIVQKFERGEMRWKVVI